MIKSGWKYYIPGIGETLDDAHDVNGWQGALYSAEDAALWATEIYWDNGGYECGIGQETEAVIVDPEGKETFWTFTYEETINCMANERKQ